MGFLSVSTHRGLVHWHGILLLVSLLTFWSPPTTAKISIETTFAIDGKDVLVRILNKPPEAVGVVWYRGNTTDINNMIAFTMTTSNLFLSGPDNNGRGTVTDDGSLLLKNATMNDTGIYTAVVHFPNSKRELVSGMLHVHEYLRGAWLLASTYWAIEDEDDVVLTCYTNGLSIQWLFNDKNLKFTKRMSLTANGRRLTIDPVKREDAGVYKCIASNHIMKAESRPLELHVQY